MLTDNVAGSGWTRCHAGRCQGVEHGPDELDGRRERRGHSQGTLNRIVNAYIEVAELQAQARRPMTMRDWSVRLDEFLRLTEREILTHAG